jgi:hypothetical protein
MALPTATATVPLGTAANFAILAKTGISTVPTSAITGNIAVSPIAAAAITGFDLIVDPVSGKFAKSTQVVGKVHAADYTSPTPSGLTTAVSDMETAYSDAAGRTPDDATLDLKGGLIGGETLTAGVYTFATDINIKNSVTVTGSDTDIFIIQTAGNVIQDANTEVILAGGAKAENIFWQVAGKVTVGAGAHMEGVLLVKTGVTFITGSSLNGRILAQTAVAVQMATITAA